MANRRFIDFPIATTVGDSDIILIWQSGVNKQTTKATFLSGLPENLDELNDVAISGLTNGQILRYDSVTGKWENTDQGNLDLNDLNDVSIVSPSNGQVLVYNSSTSKWENSSGGYVPYTGAVTTVNLGAQTIQAGQFVKAGGTSSQFLKADGSIDSTAYGTGSVTSVALTMPSAFNVANSPITSAGTLAVTGAGTVSQYIRGDGSLADFPESSGGGSSVSYYLNGSVNQGTIGGVTYQELSKIPILGAGTDFSINADGYIASFITDAGDPNLLEIPGGNWNFETYFSASSGGGSPTFYVELYKVSGSTATLIASSSSAPELIAFGTNLTPYFSTLAVPTTTLALTDRLAVRYYVTHSGRTITMHTENNHLCQIITTFTTGLTALNGLTAQVQNFAVGTSGSDFNIASATATHTFNLPTASGTNRGALSSADWSTFNNKENAITAGTTAQYFRGDKTFQTLNTSVVPELTNLYYTEARVNANANVAANTAARHNAVTLGTANGLSLSTQVLSLGLASAGVTGALSGTDWSTFNNKQNALTNPVTGTGTTNYLPKFTGSTTIGNSQIFDNGTNVGIGTSSPTFRLDVQNNTQAFARVLDTSTNASLILQAGSGSAMKVTAYNYASSTALPLYIQVDGANTIMQAGGGNLLVGTTTDNGARLQVSGTSTFGGRLLVSHATSGNYGAVIYNTSATGEGLVVRGGSTSSHSAFVVQPYDGSVSLFNVLSTGAATFSSSVTAQGSKSQFVASGGASSGAGISLNTGLSGTDRRNWFIGTEETIAGDFAIKCSTAAGGNANAGDTRLAILNNGNVGIGTSSPTNGLLVINSTAANGVRFALESSGTMNGIVALGSNAISGLATTDLALWTRGVMAFETGAGGEKMRITSGGNLLVGTTSDNGARLQVSGTARISGSGSTNLVVERTGSNGAFMQLLDGSGNSVFLGANNGDFQLQTPSGGFSNKLVVTNGGNVGIGTSSPGSLLTLSKAGSHYVQFVNSSTSNNTWIGNNSGDAWIEAGGAYGILFQTNGTERMRITSGGNVLIGSTTDNGSKLQVNGAIRTAQPVGTTSNGWLLGRALVSGTSTPNRWIRIQIGLEYYDILAVYMGTL